MFVISHSGLFLQLPGGRDLPLKEVAELRSEKGIQSILEAHPDVSLVCHHNLAEGLVFYGRRVVVVERFVGGVAKRLDVPEHVLAWVETENVGQVEEAYRARTGRAEGPWRLHDTPERTLVSNRPPR